MRPRRSVLYLPASNARAIEKARTLPCDAIILDLEDAVAPSAKDMARAQAADAIRAGGFGRRELIVRVNAGDAADLAAAAGADAVLVPKVDSADDLAWARARTPLPIWCMIETPRGVLAAAEIAAAGAQCLVAGTSDLITDLRAQPLPGRASLITALSMILLAARAHACDALDGVHLDLADAEGFAAACIQGRALGFDGKTLIHPSQIEAANQAFGVSEDEAAQAARVIAAYDDAVAHGKGVAVLDGKLVENLHVAAARRVLALAQASTRTP
jgi:citrate lyase subunit beta / citryl-CoA lyase